MKNAGKRFVAFLLSILMCASILSGSVFAVENSGSGMTVTVGKSKITVDIDTVGTSGTAQLLRYDANEYYTGDAVVGMSADIGKSGDIVGDYVCGTQQTIEFNRYSSKGEDYLYAKYYLVQNGKILAGPVYASEISSLRSVEEFEAITKKGLTLEDETTIEVAKEMGVSNTVINMDLCQLILANEDEYGKPIDHSLTPGVIEFESQGETFYFDASYVRMQDTLISAYSKEGMNVTLVVIAWAKTCTDSYPASLLYLEAEKNRQTMAFNTSTERGMQYWTAAMEFMADRYSKSSTLGLVNKFIIGNEIDYTYDWYLLQPLQNSAGVYQRVDFEIFMEEYARTLRIANNAVKKYNSEGKVVVSLTHNWAMNCYDSYNTVGNTIRYNSYAPKDICDWLIATEKARGDYDWALSVHPYPIGTTSSKPTVTDPSFSGAAGTALPITGDWRTSPWITAANLELYQLYLQQPENTCNGEVRSVYITETSICTVDENKVSAEAYQTAVYEQAASIAQYYYRGAHIDCIKEIAYFQLHDQSGYKLGLMQTGGEKKPAYDVWKYVDTNRSFSFSNRYLPYLNETSWLDVMKCVESEFDWDSVWDTDNIMTRELDTTETPRTLAVDQSTYGADEAILVTATGNEGDLVGLYKAGDDPKTTDPIYSYPVVGENKNTTYTSGKTYDIVAYGQLSALRFEDAKLKAGEYKIVLQYGDTGESLTEAITLTEDFSFGTSTLSLQTNKTVYRAGEEIIVTASGNTSCWVGIYGKDDAYGPQGKTSIYWYYVNDEDAGLLSGKPTIIQNTIHNSSSSNPSEKIGVGDYIVYLFDGSGGNEYNAVKSVEITVEAVQVSDLLSIDYRLDSDADGFANGTVTIEKPADSDSTTDCLMYWADGDGVPLEGYTSLAKFKLTGERTEYTMPTHTIIPQGAEKLIAYGFDGDVCSENYVSCDLPEGCTYSFDAAPEVEFQIISDTHVTTDSGAVGEVTLANAHFRMMLEDVQQNSPDSAGIFINGDFANTGADAEYLKAYDLYQTVANNGEGALPQLHLAIGNHDWMTGNPDDQFQRYVKIFNDSLAEQPEEVYYTEEVCGYHFVYLGGQQDGLYAVLSAEQLEWFDQKMAEFTAEDPDKPVFVLLHQPLYNTVSGSLTGQNWDGVSNEDALKHVLCKYGQIILLSGHSHWELDSACGLYAGDATMSVALNTASVAYLWSSYDVMGGRFADGSNGYYVRVYEDKVVFLGRDFENGLFVPSAAFVVQRNGIETSADAYNVAIDGEALNLEAYSLNGAGVSYETTNKNIATVTEDGTVIPRSEGEVEIVITANGDDTTVIGRKRVTIRIGEASAYRIYGDTRYETAFFTADALKTMLGVEKFSAIVVANGTNFADALSGSYLAHQAGAPIILVNASNTGAVRAYISENLAEGGTVYLLGGSAVVPDEVVYDLTGCTVKRLAGANRYETNLEILKEAGVSGGKLLVCTGTNFADGLSASAVNYPILLTGTALTEEQKSFIGGLSGTDFCIIGGTGAVSESIEAALAGYGAVERLGGATRYETSQLVAGRFFEAPEQAVIAYALDFPDGLCAGPLAMSIQAPLLLAQDGAGENAAAFCRLKGVNKGFVLGGRTLVSDYTVKDILELDMPVVEW